MNRLQPAGISAFIKLITSTSLKFPSGYFENYSLDCEVYLDLRRVQFSPEDSYLTSIAIDDTKKTISFIMWTDMVCEQGFFSTDDYELWLSRKWLKFCDSLWSKKKFWSTWEWVLMWTQNFFLQSIRSFGSVYAKCFTS